MDLSFLQPIYARPGPWASVYLDASRNTEDGAISFELRWRGQREQLEAAGAPAHTVRALERAVLGHSPRTGTYGIAAFAADGEVALLQYLPAPPRVDLAAYAPLPHAMPAVAGRGEEVAWLRVVADRTGASVDGVHSGSLARRAQIRGSESYPIRRVKPGGWAQSRFQREAVTVWKRNAGDSAAATAELAGTVGAEVVVVGGDPQARRMLVDQLPAYWRSRVVETDIGSRAPGGDRGHLDDITIQAVADIAERHTTDALDRYGVQQEAATGLTAVVDALQRAQVDTLLLVDDPSSTARLWIGPEPTQIATDANRLRQMAVADPVQVRADAALVRALAGTDADLVLVDPDEAPLDDGLGAVLRYVDASTSTVHQRP
ncbi:Vms1/Ankzf1 family peptidyl-tRNA hydrolase [Polymorphospora lycopeni]|uniref:Vms1/Ankzf1 family peptidyl-tRNA hydrolase n=1 Tax=Polymorphospora lycopeni TaxID=3140240 RepID=A0ABV5CMG9_9ACTN